MELAKQFSTIFQGMRGAYGTYNVTGLDGSKQVGQAVTYKKEVTEELWTSHLAGKTGLGIIPINEESKCYFGAIDIDEYPVDFMKIIGKVKELNLPLIPCRSKSGGLHLYLFLEEPIEAILLQGKLKEFSIKLGYGNCEIFPKQTVILVERGDMGQWINIPYFDHENTTRYGIFPDGTKMDVQDFVAQVEKLKLTTKTLLQHTIDLVNEIVDGPPCLQFLVGKKFSSGTRNEGLFNLGVYLKKADPENYQTRIYEFNTAYIDPPVSSYEVANLVKSLNRKDYMYTCSKPPLKQHCNNELCRTKKHGISVLFTGNFKLENLTKYNSDPPIWFVNLAGTSIRLELTTDDLQNQIKFQKRCLEAANIYPPSMNKDGWLLMVQNLLKNVVVIDAPKDTTFKGQFIDLLEKFCTSRVQAKTKSDILLGKPWSENKFVYFRLSDLQAFLERQHFKELKVHQVAAILRDLGGEHSTIRILNKQVNCWSIPEFSKVEGVFEVKGIAEEETI
jgi:hypothetical protein